MTSADPSPEAAEPPSPDEPWIDPVSVEERAFYVAEHSLSLNRRELIIVVADIWTCTLALKREVLVALNLALPAAPGQGTRWDDANVMLCGTHTHAAPGGYSEYARLQAEWTIPLPAGLTLRESMILGTAGFTAVLV